MKVLGVISSIAAAAAALAASVVLVMAVPDIKRYLRMRAM